MTTTSKISDEWRTPDELFNVLDKGGVYQGIEFKGFNFNIDLCATKENAKYDMYVEDYLNGEYYLHKHLKCTYKNITLKEKLKELNVAFINPPYSKPRPFIEKAWEDSKYCKIVCLVKCDPSTKWWTTFYDYNVKVCEAHSFLGIYKTEDDNFKCAHCSNAGKFFSSIIYRGPKPGCDIIYFHKRIKFDPPIGVTYCTCTGVHGAGFYVGSVRSCKSCKQPLLRGPTFPSALIIMDRRV